MAVTSGLKRVKLREEGLNCGCSVAWCHVPGWDTMVTKCMEEILCLDGG